MLVAAAVSLELGAVTSASSQPDAPSERFGPVEAGCSETRVLARKRAVTKTALQTIPENLRLVQCR